MGTFPGSLKASVSLIQWKGNSHWIGSVRWMCNTCRQKPPHAQTAAAVNTVVPYISSGRHHKGHFVIDCHATLSGQCKDQKVVATLHSTLLVNIGSSLWRMRTAGLGSWSQESCLVKLQQAGI